VPKQTTFMFKYSNGTSRGISISWNQLTKWGGKKMVSKLLAVKLPMSKRGFPSDKRAKRHNILNATNLILYNNSVTNFYKKSWF